MTNLILRERLQQFLLTALLGVAMLALLLWTGWQVLGTYGLLIFGGVGLLFFVLAARRSPSALLANGIPVRYADAPEIHRIVHNLARRAELPATPRLYYLPTPVMNALTIGTRGDAVIMLTQGLITRLTARELEGVIAHEIGHLRNNDLRLFALSQYLREATDFISRFGWLLLLFSLPLMVVSHVAISAGAVFALLAAPLLSMVLQLALLRTREFSADLAAAELTEDPDGLASALRKLENPRSSIFDYFFPVVRRRDSSLFRTHPATEERIRRLDELTTDRSHWGLPPKISGYRY
ncbi:MAG TPA: zinc metalloprotease HtpX [Spirochaetia bacterium]|nr:zinc metalloprotease HtpX [Spirochaetia bacterium]